MYIDSTGLQTAQKPDISERSIEAANAALQSYCDQRGYEYVSYSNNGTDSTYFKREIESVLFVIKEENRTLRVKDECITWPREAVEDIEELYTDLLRQGAPQPQ